MRALEDNAPTLKEKKQEAKPVAKQEELEAKQEEELEEQDGRDAETAAENLKWLEDRLQRIGLDWNSYLETGELALCCMIVVLTVLH